MSSSTPLPTSAPTIRGYTGEEFLNLRIPEKEALIEDLLHRRDLVAFGARRRHGKTTFALNMAVAGAIGLPEFIGYKIARPFRTLLFMLEDDPGDLKAPFEKIAAGQDLYGRIRIVTREDFYREGIRIDVSEKKFRDAIRALAREHHPDVIVFDNLAHVLGGDYSDAKKVQELMTVAYLLASQENAAIIFPAHPRKQDAKNKISLEGDAELYVEQIMGSSHFINSTGSIWAMERRDDLGHSLFMGGRQRSAGISGHRLLYKDDDGWLKVLDNAGAQLAVVVNTRQRFEAWRLLPPHPQPFGYREGEGLVKAFMRSASTFHAWIKHCRGVGVIIEVDGKLCKAPGLPDMSGPGQVVPL